MRADVNKFVSTVLGAGVILSLVTLIYGSVLFLLHPVHAERPGSVLHILQGVARLDPIATINLGLLILLLTPVTRVIAAMIAFIIDKDTKYALISLAVLTVLIISAVLGKGA